MQKYLTYDLIQNSDYFHFIKKIIIFIFVAVFQTVCYLFVNYISPYYPADSLYNINIFIDELIPYLGFSWFIYYSGDIYMFIWSFYILQKLDEKEFLFSIRMYLTMIIIGAVMQIIIPAKSPYPNELSDIHYFIHNNILDAPYGCFPSMHVALCIFPILICLKYHSYSIKIISVIWAMLICISTLTLKEHYFMDVMAGLILAIIFAFIFYMRYRIK